MFLTIKQYLHLKTELFEIELFVRLELYLN